MENAEIQKNAEFMCINCHFKCCKNSEWIRHINTIKHVHRVNGNKMENAEIQKNATYICKCGKQFLSNSGLWKHKKSCVNDKVSKKQSKNTETTKDELINYLIKENKEFKNLILEIVKKDNFNNHNITNSNNTNSLNKTFNLQFFLNETCKDAMNIMDFVDSIKLQLTDLEKVGEIGYVEGISNIITTNLKALDVTQRPIHCTDKKRETLYIKDEDKWEKENEEKKKLKKVIKKVANKNILLLQKFKEAHPDCGKSDSRFSDQYNKIIIESMGGSGDNDIEKEAKIIQNISNVTTIDK